MNFDPRAIKVLNSAVAKYTYLQKTFVPSLPSLFANKKLKIQNGALLNPPCLRNKIHHHILVMCLPYKGFVNSDGNGYAGCILQYLLNSKAIQSKLVKESNENIKQLVALNESPDHTPIDASRICNELVSTSTNHSPVEFLTL